MTHHARRIHQLHDAAHNKEKKTMSEEIKQQVFDWLRANGFKSVEHHVSDDRFSKHAHDDLIFTSAANDDSLSERGVDCPEDISEFIRQPFCDANFVEAVVCWSVDDETVQVSGTYFELLTEEYEWGE